MKEGKIAKFAFSELNVYPKGTSSLHCVAVRAPNGSYKANLI